MSHRAWIKIYIALILLGMLLLPLLPAGCSSAISQTSSSQGEIQLEHVKLNLYMPQPYYKEQFESHIAAFIEQQKTEKNRLVEIQLEVPKDEINKNILRARLISGDAPDVFMANSTSELADYYKAGYLADLSGQPFVSLLKDDAKAAVTVDGKVVAVPVETPIWGYLYNKEIFELYNISLPETITEMKAVCEKLQAFGMTPFVLTYKTPSMTRLHLQAAASILVNSELPDFVAGKKINHGSFSEMGSTIFDFFDLMKTYGNKDALIMDTDAGAAAFVNGEGAMWQQGSWYAASLKSLDENFEFGIAPIPIDDNPDHTCLIGSYSTTYVASATSKNMDVTLDFMNFFFDDTASNNFYKSIHANPVATNQTFEIDTWVQDAIDTGNVIPEVFLPSPVLEEGAQAYQSYFAGKMSRDDVLATLDRAWLEYNVNP